MKIDKLVLQRLKMPLKTPFETSFNRQTDKDFILVRAIGGETGFGESVGMAFPFYNEETTDTIWYMLDRFLIPLIFQSPVHHPKEIWERFQPIRRNFMAKACLESALWDLFCKQKGISLAAELGGEKTEIDVGVSIGIESNVKALVKKVGIYLSEGYKKIKIKMKPGFDLEPVAAIRREFGEDVPLMVDANSAYTLDDLSLFKKLDRYHLLMIEQPLAHDDIIDHAKLQKEMDTPICLDESIHSLEDTRKAIELGSCRIINIKPGRVGGIWEAVRIHDFCKERNVPVWCGGMLETGIGKAHNIALSSLDHFTIPGDTSESRRYWREDIVDPGISFVEPGKIAVPELPGIGVQVREDLVDQYTTCTKSYDNRGHMV